MVEIARKLRGRETCKYCGMQWDQYLVTVEHGDLKDRANVASCLCGWTLGPEWDARGTKFFLYDNPRKNP